MIIKRYELVFFFCLSALLTACASKPVSKFEAAAQDRSTFNQNIAALDQAEQLYRNADWPRAQAAYEELSKGFPKNSFIWFRLGNVMARQGQYEAAVAAYNSAISADSTNVVAAYNVGLLRLAQADSAFELAEARLRNQPELAQQIKSFRQATRDQLERAMHGGSSEVTLSEEKLKTGKQ